MKLLRDVYTGPDGKAWALGRVYSLPVLLVGLAYPVTALIRAQHVQHDMPYSLHEVGMYLMELGAATLLLVRGTTQSTMSPQTRSTPQCLRLAPAASSPRTPTVDSCLNKQTIGCPEPMDLRHRAGDRQVRCLPQAVLHPGRKHHAAPPPHRAWLLFAGPMRRPRQCSARASLLSPPRPDRRGQGPLNPDRPDPLQTLDPQGRGGGKGK
jgi:hypothetical protein